MDVIYPRCCGLDIHKKTVVACLMTSEAGQSPAQTTRTFRTMHSEQNRATRADVTPASATAGPTSGTPAATD
jgi:hypothetical protein